ncbi:exonuclease SbcCD subunit D [Candidatus Pacearchaeota archaeon]|nr:exonuclease SbcCD subunit D [Candidatus Pacearchaeota archaeon]
MKFAHISDSHLGGWRQPEMQLLNIESFKKAIECCIEEKVEFVLFTGDLFDSPFPPIEILKDTFSEFRKLKEAGIKSYIIAGSHDYSVSGKTFLDVLEKSGFCEICKFDENEDKVILKPIMHKSFYIYGYPGKKSGLELSSLKKIEIIEPYSNYFRILMLHTTIKEAIENIPIDSIPLNELPKADYYALGHVHVNFEKEINDKPAVYGGPTFPNNFKELEDLKYGAFYIIDVEGYTKIIRKEIRLKEVDLIEVEMEDALKGTEQILEILKRLNLRDRIVLLKVFGELKKGKLSDIKFQEIQDYLEKNGVYSFLKNTSKLEAGKKEIEVNLQSYEMEKIEDVLVKKYDKENPSNLNKLIFPLIESLSLEKQEGENSSVFESRLFSGLNKVLNIEL